VNNYALKFAFIRNKNSFISSRLLQQHLSLLAGSVVFHSLKAAETLLKQ